MSNAKTGFAAAVGAILGGAAGAYAGKFAATQRPRVKYVANGGGAAIEDAMTVGAAAGAVVGSFIFGTIASPETPPALPPVQR